MPQNEITVNMSATLNNGRVTTFASCIFNSLFAGNFIGDTQPISASPTLLTLADTPEHVFVKNLDDIHYVEVDSASTFDKFPQRILPGMGIFLMPQTGTIYAKAQTGTVNVFVGAG